MSLRRGGLPDIFRIALAALAFCASAAQAQQELPPSAARQAERERKAAGAFDIDLQAPDAVRGYLDRHLELHRYRELTDLDAGELARLMEAARANVRELLGTLGYFSPEVVVELRAPRTVVIRATPGAPVRVTDVSIGFAGPIAADPNRGNAPQGVREGSTPDDDLPQRRAIQASWLLRTGDAFTQAAWDDAKSEALRGLTARKYPAGRIAASQADIDPDTHAAKLSVLLDSGSAYRLGPVRVEGLARFQPELALRLARLRQGADYDQAALLEAQQRLADSGYFSSAFISLDTSGDPAAAPVQIQVREAPLQKVVLGIGASTDSGARLSVEHTHQLLPWIGWRAVSKLSLDRETQSIGTELTAPPDEGNWRWVTSALLQRQDAADVEVASQRLRLGRTQAGDRIDRNYYLQYDRARTTGVATDELASALSANYAWTLRRFDSLPFPTRGWGLGLELGGGVTLGSDRQPFLRTLGRWQAYFPLETGERSGLPVARAGRIATRAEAGAVLARPAAVLPSTQLFLTGGDTTVRGYGLREIGSLQPGGTVEPGRYLAVGSVEYQRPISWNGRLTDWENTVFVDAGAVADKPDQLRAKVGVGTGVRWKSPVGPLQIDVAYGVATHKLRLHLNVGFTFLTRRALLLWPLGVLAGVLATLLMALAAGWWWAASSGSLQGALARAARWLPPGHEWQAEGVTGTLLGGGHIDRLRWAYNGLEIEVIDLSVAWRPGPLLRYRVQLDTLRAAQVHVRDQRVPAATGHAAPIEQLALPVQVDTPVEIAALDYRGPVAFTATALAAHYAFDGTQHRLRLASLAVAEGRYGGEATLQAASPMALDARLAGSLQAPLPGRAPLSLDATASAQGTLGGAAATLDLQAELLPAGGSRTQASLRARVQPWQPQPVMQADARWRELDLALLWPGAPRTLLEGSAQVAPIPAATGAAPSPSWRAAVQAVNRAPGPWDEGRLPVGALQLEGELDERAWAFPRATAELAGGTLEASGRWVRAASAGTPAGWTGRARLAHVDPAALHTQLAQAALDGTLEARALDGAGATPAIGFDAQLRPLGAPAGASRLAGLAIAGAEARGQWDGSTLTLRTLRVRAQGASLQGDGSIQLATRAMRGQLQLVLPGAQLEAQGALSARAGDGNASVAVADAQRAQAWLARLPGLAFIAARGSAAGNGTLDLRWQGGWQQDARDLQLQARARLPRLDWAAAGQPAEQALRLRELQADVAGRPSALTLAASGSAQQGALRVQLQARAEAGRQAGGTWSGRLLEASASATSELRLQARATPWRARLAQPVAFEWQGGGAGQRLNIAAGEVSLQAPSEGGTAALQWEPIRWTKLDGRMAFASRGRLRGVPQAWAELLGQTQLAALGLTGDLLFDGDWDVASDERLQLRASMARRSGDVQLQLGDSGSDAQKAAGETIRAGVREARIDLRADGDALHASLRWDSASAGQAQADIETRLARGASGALQWAADAPLSGSVQARLPQVGIWSVLAPPGWRLRGTLDAKATLSGTRAAPEWRGSIAADELALRSVVDGIEFSNGQLRATLAGQRLAIDSFTLRGGTAPGGGQLTAQGSLEWLPAGGPSNASAASRVRMALSARADGLRVSARADRRLVVSGTLNAQLEQAVFRLRGSLRADQALFILPEDNAPALSDDVLVRGRDGVAANAAAAAQAEPAGVRVVPDVDLALDLGPAFQLQGRGVSTRLAGTLVLRSTPLGQRAGTPRLTGDVRTVRGSYKAYGQNLDIEEGLLRFAGPYDNPTLSILAIRPNLQQRVGVQISGTALLPRVRLYAEPDLPDAEKLAWLVLGRGAANGGAEAAVLQQAALALLGGNGRGLSGGLAESLGLDELSFRGAASNVDGTSASAAAVTLGKRLSRNFYVAYERSLAGTLGTFYIFYDLSRRLTVRAQAGEQSAVDLLFTFTYD